MKLRDKSEDDEKFALKSTQGNDELELLRGMKMYL